MNYTQSITEPESIEEVENGGRTKEATSYSDCTRLRLSL